MSVRRPRRKEEVEPCVAIEIGNRHVDQPAVVLATNLGEDRFGDVDEHVATGVEDPEWLFLNDLDTPVAIEVSNRRIFEAIALVVLIAHGLGHIVEGSVSILLEDCRG